MSGSRGEPSPGGAASGHRGRPRSLAAREAAQAAALDLLQARGYGGMSMEAVAERAGVAKTTLYRHWPSRAALAIDAFYAVTRDALAFPDTGSAREDFRLQIQGVAALLRGSSGAAFAAMVAGSLTDAVLAQCLAERWVMPRQRWGIQRLTQAMADGECEQDLDIPAALSALYSPIYAPLLVGLGVPDEARIDAVLTLVFRGIFRTPKGSATRGR